MSDYENEMEKKEEEQSDLLEEEEEEEKLFAELDPNEVQL